jgi:hypothetical protein
MGAKASAVRKTANVIDRPERVLDVLFDNVVLIYVSSREIDLRLMSRLHQIK